VFHVRYELNSYIFYVNAFSLQRVNTALLHEDVWDSGDIAPPFLTSALDGGEWSASFPGRFTPGETAPGTHWTGGSVGPRTGLDAEKRKISLPRRESNTGRPAPGPSRNRLSYPGS
jgi:hypothetical protein